jgi:hypothetical protein
MTIHSWFRGGVIRYAKRAKIEVFIKLVEEDLSERYGWQTNNFRESQIAELT